jgi:hypothetical protein
VLPSLIFITDTGSAAAEAGGEDPEGGDCAAEEGASGLRGLQGDPNHTKLRAKPNLTRLHIEKKKVLRKF